MSSGLHGSLDWVPSPSAQDQFYFFSSSDRAVDIYSKMLSKQKKGDRGPRMEQIELKRQEEQAEMERLRQIRQQEQNELQIKAEVERRVQNEVSNIRSFGVKLKSTIRCTNQG